MRTIVSLIAIIVAVASLAACGGLSAADNATATPTSTTVDTTTPTTGAGATSTTTSAATPATAPAQATSAPKPTTAPVPTQATNNQPSPTAAPVPTPTPVPSSPSGKTVTVWFQLTDSCKQALPGGSVVVNGPGITNKVVSVSGSLVGLNTYQHSCPVQRGTCVQTNSGCGSVALGIPASGTATYTITPAAIGGSHYLSGIVYQPPSPLGANYAYVYCEGGSDCRAGPEFATIHVTSGGSVSATTQNVNPDGFRDAPWPTGGTFATTQGDPVMFHLFGASGPNDFTITCMSDGTHLLRDHMTGTPNWPHCNSGR